MTKNITTLFTLLALSGALPAAFGQKPQLTLMPWPSEVTVNTGSISIDGNFSVAVSGAGANDPRVTFAVQRLFTRLARQTGIPILPHVVPASGSATLNIVVESRDHKPPQRLGDDERYSLDAASGRIRISADQPLGALRGIETFLQLVQQNVDGPPGFAVAAVTVHDGPRFPWRGLSLDVSRHFIPVDGVERTLDGVSAVKLNVLHWHLSDDQGFRVESKKYPRLQQLGSDSLYYTQSQIREVVEFARARGVRVVPEFDMPGHATSWLPGYPKLGAASGPFNIVRGYGIWGDLLDPTKESTYRFLDNFVGEMSKLFPDEYFHIGGDEVNPKEWNESASVRAFMQKRNLADAKALQAYFNQRLQKIVQKHGKHMEGWDEVLHPDLPKSVVIQSWRGQKSLWEAARQGYQGILSAGYYLDLMYPASYHYSVDPMKTPPPAPKNSGEEQASQGPAPGTPADLSPEQAKLILGGEAAMWEELASAEVLDAKLWPRLAAIAERFWSPESTTDVNSMYARLAITNRWLEWLGLTQRSNLELMRQRLAGTMPHTPLDTLVSVLEPVRGYTRNAEKYKTDTPLNRLIDSIPPESAYARQFGQAVDRFLAQPVQERSSEELRRELTRLSYAAAEARPIMQSNSLLQPDLPVADAVSALSQVGLEALGYLNATNPARGDWKQKSTSAVSPYINKRVGDFLIPIAPPIQKLVDAVQ